MHISPDESDSDIPAGFRVVEISREPIELYKILKFEGIADSGGHARAAVASSKVLVNGVTETQKRKKISSGDTIEYQEHKLLIRYRAPEIPDEVTSQAKAKNPPDKQKDITQTDGAALVKRAKKT